MYKCCADEKAKLIWRKATETEFNTTNSSSSDDVDSSPNDVLFTLDAVKALSGTRNLCITGPALTHILHDYTHTQVDLLHYRLYMYTVLTITYVFIANPSVHIYFHTLYTYPPHTYTQVSAICPWISTFARVSPAQKEAIVRSLNDAGLYTLMCGDG